MCNAKDVSFPPGNPDQLANDFGNFFGQKIEKINWSQADRSAQSQSLPRADEHSVYVDGRLTSFKSLTQDQVRTFIEKGAKKSCQLNPVPTSVVLLSPGKRRLSCLLLRSLTWTLPIRISVQ